MQEQIANDHKWAKNEPIPMHDENCYHKWAQHLLRRKTGDYPEWTHFLAQGNLSMTMIGVMF